jgi:hypothetical protein
MWNAPLRFSGMGVLVLVYSAQKLNTIWKHKGKFTDSPDEVKTKANLRTHATETMSLMWPTLLLLSSMIDGNKPSMLTNIVFRQHTNI